VIDDPNKRARMVNNWTKGPLRNKFTVEPGVQPFSCGLMV
jgi:hypothetical protein